MSDSPHTCVVVDEETPLKTVQGSGEPQKAGGRAAARGGPRFHDKHHRWLAICSIVCGISCIGIKALINSVKAEREPDEEASERFSRRARKLGIISIVTWLSILALAPLLLALGSYLITLQD